MVRGAEPATRPPRRVAWVALAVLGLDQATKWWAWHALALGDSVPLWPGIVHLTLVRNPGIAFGLLSNARGMAVGVVVAVAMGLLLLSLRRPAGLWTGREPTRVGFGLLLGGAAGNLLDRLSVGGVIDFLDLRVWPVFNVADSAITLGALGLLWAWWRDRREA